MSGHSQMFSCQKQAPMTACTQGQPPWDTMNLPRGKSAAMRLMISGLLYETSGPARPPSMRMTGIPCAWHISYTG